MKRKWVFGTILALMLIFALLRIDRESLLHSLNQIPLWVALLMFGLQIISQLLVNLQWHKIAKLSDISISFGDMLYVNCQGSVIDSITPGVKFGGEVTRAIQISRTTKCCAEQAAAVVVTQKLFSLCALFLILSFAVGWYLVLPFLLIFLCIFIMPNHIKFYLQTKKDPRFVWMRKMKDFAIASLEQVNNIRKSKKSLAMLFLLSLFIWLLYPAKMYFLTAQFYPDVHIVHIVAITFAAYMIAMLPIFPGGLGGFEATMTGLLIAIGMIISDAAVITIFFRFTTFWLVMLCSLVFIALHKLHTTWRLKQQ